MGFVRKNLSADGLHQAVRNSLYKEKLPELKKTNISWQDCIILDFAVEYVTRARKVMKIQEIFIKFNESSSTPTVN